MFSDTSLFDIKEQVDILLKAAFGFPSTSDTLPWYLETNVKFNNYLFGEEVFLNEITSTPVFNGSGVKTLQQSGYGLTISDFVDFSDNSNDPDKCSIVDDTTGNVRRFQNLILDPCPGLGNNTGDSWFKYDTSQNLNILSDTFQFNYKQYIDSTGAPQLPYKYRLTSQQAITKDDPNIPLGQDGGNWNLDFKSGILLFLDSENLSFSTRDQSYNVKLKEGSSFINKPVFTFYKYIGKKGISTLDTKITNLESSLNNLSISFDLPTSIIDFSNYVIDLSNYVYKLENSLNLIISDVSNLNLKIDSSFSNVFRDISGLISRVDSSLSTVFQDISNLNVKIDSSLSSVIQDISGLSTSVDSSLSSIIQDISGLSTSVDSSLSSVIQDISGLSSSVDSSLSSIIQDISGLSSSVDSSFIAISQSFTTGKISVASDISSYGHIYASEFRNISGTELIIDPRPFNSGLENDVSGTVIIRGDLRVKGTTTLVNTQNLLISGNFLEINVSDSSLFGDTGGIILDFSGDKKYLVYNNTGDGFWDFSGETVKLGDFDISGIKFTDIKQNIDSSLSSLNSKIVHDINSLRNSFDLSLNNKADKTYIDGSLSIILSDISNRIDISISTAFNDITLLNQSLSGSGSGSGSNNEIVNICGQTFFEIMTQQPNLFKRVNETSTSTQIKLEWNFDNIIARQNGTDLRLAQDFNSSIDTSGSNELLPVIKQIYIDISQGSINNTYTTINCANNYNTSSHKNFTLNHSDNILGINKDQLFDVIVYGKNGATNFPSIDDRKLVYSVQFSRSQKPDQPLINFVTANNIPTNFTINKTSSNNILTLDVLFNNNGPERLFQAELSYNINTNVPKYRSELYLDNNSIFNIDFTDNQLLNVISGGTFTVNFNDIITNSLYGTSYYFQIRTKNNINIEYSDFSPIIEYSFNSLLSSLIPTPTDITQSLSPPVTGNVANTTIYVYDAINSTFNTINKPILLLSPNTTRTNTTNNKTRVHSIYNSNYNLQTILPSQTILLTDTNAIACGKSVDNKKIAVFKTNINNISSTEKVIDISGFNGTTITNDSRYSFTETNTGNLIKQILISDVYASNNLTHKSKRGWHIKAEIDFLDTISYGLFINSNDTLYQIENLTIGNSINYVYQRQSSATNGNNPIDNSITLNNIWTDDLPEDPSNNSSSFQITNVSIKRNFGLPSIHKFDYTITNTYTNINSSNTIFTNRQFAYINGITNTNHNSNLYVPEINSSDVSGHGIYTKDITVNDVNYTSAITSKNNTLSSRHYVTNIKYTNYELDSINNRANHFCDYNSYTNQSNIIVSPKIDLTKIHVSQINDIYYLSDISNITISQYNNHDNSLNLWSLLYYKGEFKRASEYPNISDFSFSIPYNGPDITSTRYNIHGQPVSINEKGYNWIVLTLEFVSSGVWKFNGQNYQNDTQNSTQTLNLQPILKNSNLPLFNNNIDLIFSSILSDNTLNSLSFVRTRKTGGFGVGDYAIGSLKGVNDPNSSWYNFSSGSNKPNNVTQIFYGTYYGARYNLTDYNIVIDKGNMQADLELFFGLSDVATIN